MNYEENRLRTFQNWPSNAGVDPRKIAKAGFYYMGQGTEVQCFSCGGRISDWNYGDKVVAVITRHKMLDPNCPFIRDAEASGNVSIFSSSSRRVCESSSRSSVESESSRLPETLPESNRSESSNYRKNVGSCRVLQGCSLSSSSHTQLPSLRKEMFHNEKARLESFHSWPLSYISPQALSKAGFFYTGQDDKVECYSCEGTVEGWEEGDSPLEEHRRHYPSCPFLLSLNHGVHIRRNSTDSHYFNGEYEGLKHLGIHQHRAPKSPEYSTYEARMRSFENWPPSIHQKPHQLADAGFYFTGRGDQVRCFHCDGGLRLWESGDQPWEEHARWFSDCGFLFLVRGQKFINQAVASLRSHQPSSIKLEGRGVKRKQQKKVRTVTEEELHAAMSSPIARSALEVGLEVYRVKQALKHRLEMCGEPFCRAEDLIGAAFNVQMMDEESETDDVWGTPPNSPAIFGKSRVSPGRECLSRQSSSSPLQSPNRELLRFSNLDSTNQNDDSVLKTPLTSSQSDFGAPLSDLPNKEEARSSPANSSSSGKSIGELEEEIRKLREWRQCKVCMDNEVGVVLLPCGHLVTCVQCMHSLTDCPLCRQPIKATVRTFLS